MKKLLVVLLCMATLISCKKEEEEQLIYRIPDPEFRSYIIRNFDTNEDFDLSNEEVLAITKIRLYGISKIRSLEGLEIFKNLYGFYTGDLKISTIDLSKNRELLFIDIQRMPNLTTIYLPSYLEGFVSLDVPSHVSITYK